AAHYAPRGRRAAGRAGLDVVHARRLRAPARAGGLAATRLADLPRSRLEHRIPVHAVLPAVRLPRGLVLPGHGADQALPDSQRAGPDLALAPPPPCCVSAPDSSSP